MHDVTSATALGGCVHRAAEGPVMAFSFHFRCDGRPGDGCRLLSHSGPALLRRWVRGGLRTAVPLIFPVDGVARQGGIEEDGCERMLCRSEDKGCTATSLLVGVRRSKKPLNKKLGMFPGGRGVLFFKMFPGKSE